MVTHMFSLCILLYVGMFVCVSVCVPLMAIVFSHSMVYCVCVCVRVHTVCFVAMVTLSALFFSAEVWGDATEAGDVISQLWTSSVQTHEVSRKGTNPTH